MLFRRIREHVRRHDWFAVGIDLLVVILGIYLGFQVTAWDEERRLLSQREDYLNRLVVDLKDDVEEAAIVDRLNRLRAGAIKKLELAIAGEQPESDTSELSMEELVMLNGTRRIFLRRDTFDEMQASGKFGLLINDRSLGDDLVEYYSDRVVRDQFVATQEHYEERFREQFAGVLTSDQLLGYWPDLFKSQVDYDFPEVPGGSSEVQTVVDAVKARPELVATLPNLKSTKVQQMREANIVGRQAEALIGRIETMLQTGSSVRAE